MGPAPPPNEGHGWVGGASKAAQTEGADYVDQRPWQRGALDGRRQGGVAVDLEEERVQLNLHIVTLHIENNLNRVTVPSSDQC